MDHPNVKRMLFTLNLVQENPSLTIKKIKVSRLEKEFKKRFCNQVFDEDQSVQIEHNGLIFRADVADFDIGLKIDTDYSLTPVHGIVRDSTKILFEVPENLASLVQGAQVTRSIFRKGFDVNKIDMSLASLGIGGLSMEFKTLLIEALASRMHHPSEARRRQSRHVRGILLYGPPGSGKTLLARNICRILNAHEPKVVLGPELRTSMVGASEEKIRNLFSAAIEEERKLGSKSKLHVIIFDEFDCMARKRGGFNNVHGDNCTTQLLAMIDGVKELHNILLIATTNQKHSIDDAMLRDGRIDLHIKIDYPNMEGRLDILDILTRRMRRASRLGDDVNLEEIARVTPGFGGAALSGLVSRASRYALARAEGNSILMQDQRARVTMEHFLRAVKFAKRKRHHSLNHSHNHVVKAILILSVVLCSPG